MRGRAGQVLGVCSVVLALGLAGCSPPPGSQGTAPSPDSPVTAAASGNSAPTDRDAYIARGPAHLDPSAFKHGDFVGAIDLEYLGARTSPTAKEADAKYAAYFKGKYSPPQPGEHNGIRLNAMSDPRDGERLLFKGAIIDTITLPNEIVLGLHNITRIEGGVAINGRVYEGHVAGANGTMVVGDHMTIWVPDPHYPDLVDRYVYEVVPSESGGDYLLVSTSAPAFEDTIYKASPADDVYQLSLYVCWPPNQSIQRLVTRMRLLESSIEVGSVRPVDA